MGFDTIYTKGLKKKIDRFGVWEPGTPIKLGDIGVFDGKQFHQYANIKDFGITFKKSVGNKNEKGATISKGKYNKTLVNLSGKSELYDTEINISFDSDEALYVDSIGSRICSIANLIALEKDILKLNDQWRDEWSVITQIQTVDRATIIISKSKNSSIVFGVSAEVDLKVNLAELKSGLTVIRESQTMYNNTVDGPVALSFKASRLKKKLFGGTRLMASRKRLISKAHKSLYPSMAHKSLYPSMALENTFKQKEMYRLEDICG